MGGPVDRGVVGRRGRARARGVGRRGDGRPAGRLLVGLAALAVLAVDGRRRARPAPAAVDDARPRPCAAWHGRWPHIDAVRVVRMRRMGLPAADLEVEARDGARTPTPTDRLLVLGRLELGTDPVDVAESLQRCARAGRRAAGRPESRG